MLKHEVKVSKTVITDSLYNEIYCKLWLAK